MVPLGQFGIKPLEQSDPLTHITEEPPELDEEVADLHGGERGSIQYEALLKQHGVPSGKQLNEVVPAGQFGISPVEQRAPLVHLGAPDEVTPLLDVEVAPEEVPEPDELLTEPLEVLEILPEDDEVVVPEVPLDELLEPVVPEVLEIH